MGETLNVVIQARENGSYEIEVRESWSGYAVRDIFIPPYTSRQITVLQKRLNTLDSSDGELQRIGYRLFSALCGSTNATASDQPVAQDRSVQGVLQGVIQRTLRRRGTVALTLIFGPGCEEFIRYPWELLHNGDHFLLVSGVFTLTRALWRPDAPISCGLPVQPPFRVLYIGSSPIDCAPLETERSFHEMEEALSPLIDAGQVFLDRLEPPTFGQLVRYLNSYGGAGMLDDSETTYPCYIVHFDGHGVYGRLCPAENCETVNDPEVRRCRACGALLTRIKPQTYLCFCDDEGYNSFVDTQSLRRLLLSSDVRLTVLSACETAAVTAEHAVQQQQQQTAIDASLATALVTAQVPAVVAMPFSLQDDLTPIFMYHFYEALASHRTLEEALSRARQAMLIRQQKSWFIPVLYRHVAEGDEGPVPFLASADAVGERAHPLRHLMPPASFVGRERELRELDTVLTNAAVGEETFESNGRMRTRQFYHQIALTGAAGIGKSALAYEVVRRNRDKFPGGIIGISLQDGKTFADALLEIVQAMHISGGTRTNVTTTDGKYRARLVLNVLRSLANRELPCLLLLDSFEEIVDRTELEAWLQFLNELPLETTVLLTSRLNPAHMMVTEGYQGRWYEYRVGKMTNENLLRLFIELAGSSGLDHRIQLDNPKQQQILQEICMLLDGYPLGAELLFGTARSIYGQLYTPEAATRSLEEVRDELHNIPLAGIQAVLEVAYNRLSTLARLLLSYLAAFKLPFNREQIAMLIAPGTLSSVPEVIQQFPDTFTQNEVVSTALAHTWRSARDELVQASFMHFDGNLYTIHLQTRNFALAQLPLEEKRRVHRVVAAYYHHLPQPGAAEWLEAVEHLEAAGELRDLQEAVHVVVRASIALEGEGYLRELLPMLQRAAGYVNRLGDRVGEAQVQCRLGVSLRHLGQTAAAESCLKQSLVIYQQLDQHDLAEHIGWLYYELALLCCITGDFRQANVYAQQGVAVFQSKQHVAGEGWCYIALSQIEISQAQYTQAGNYLERAEACMRQVDDRAGLATLLSKRGLIHTALGQYTRAVRCYEEALRMFRELHHPLDQIWVELYRGRVYLLQGKLDLAEKDANEALTYFRAAHIERGQALALQLLGDISTKRADFANARGYYQGASTLLGTIGDYVCQALVLNAFGVLALREDAHLEARNFYEQAQAIAREYNVRYIDALALRGLGDIAQLESKLAESMRYYRDAGRIFAALTLSYEQGAVLFLLGQVYVRAQKYREALDTWVRALALDLDYDVRSDLQEQLDILVNSQHLEAFYEQSREQSGLA
ncbi:MAG TPA: tetratricopeptide repeat protein [Dictyobacter sp.]|nr:tetratricopeptide repeat protein [Dictyobacter sp.]